MSFTLGIIVGIMLSILMVATLTFFRRVIEHRIEIVEKQIELKGPRPRGFIVMPDDESDVIRSEVIERNRKLGKDTPIKDLL